MLIFKHNYDLLCRISATEMISKCVMHRNAFILLCFPEIYPCFLTSKEKIPTQKNESSTEARNIHSNIWMYWKGKEMGSFFLNTNVYSYEKKFLLKVH